MVIFMNTWRIYTKVGLFQVSWPPSGVLFCKVYHVCRCRCRVYISWRSGVQIPTDVGEYFNFPILLLQNSSLEISFIFSETDWDGEDDSPYTCDGQPDWDKGRSNAKGLKDLLKTKKNGECKNDAPKDVNNPNSCYWLKEKIKVRDFFPH